MFNYLILLILLPSINAINFNLTSKCNYPLNLYTNENNQFIKLCDLDQNNKNCQINYDNIPSGLIKHTLDADATLFEFSINNMGIWYDISVIPPGSGVCYSYDECRQKSNSDSFNVPMDVIPKNINPLYSSSCISLICHESQCSDAYLFPYDDLKTRFCPLKTDFDIIFCNNETVTEPINETVTEPFNETVNETITEPVTEPINETVNETIIEQVIDSVNETVIELVNPNIEEISIIHRNNDNKLLEMMVSVCKDASYIIPGPICSGSGIFPTGINCPLMGTETEYDCQPGAINYKDGKCIAHEDAKCTKHKDVWKCIYPSIGCNDNNQINNNQINDNQINDNQTDLINDNQTDLINDNQTDLIDNNQTDLINNNQTDLIDNNQTDLINNNQIDFIDNNQTALYKLLNFNWKDSNNWEYSSGNIVPESMFENNQITLSSENSPEPIRTKMSWAGEKIIIFEWERSDNSDTNIWMLNEKLRNQFEKNNGWPYWGELDIFEMFTEDKILQPQYDFTGFKDFTDVSSYGQLTLHMGPKHEDGDPCFCPSSYTKELWYQDIKYMTSSCTGQIENINNNKVAMIFGIDEIGHYLQLIQFPIIKQIDNLYSIISDNNSNILSRIYNNRELFWGVPSNVDCARNGGHNPNTGFPFFEEFYIVLEEQKKDPDSWFKINNIEIYIKN